MERLTTMERLSADTLADHAPVAAKQSALSVPAQVSRIERLSTMERLSADTGAPAVGANESRTNALAVAGVSRLQRLLSGGTTSPTITEIGGTAGVAAAEPPPSPRDPGTMLQRVSQVLSRPAALAVPAAMTRFKQLGALVSQISPMQSRISYEDAPTPTQLSAEASMGDALPVGAAGFGFAADIEPVEASQDPMLSRISDTFNDGVALVAAAVPSRESTLAPPLQSMDAVRPRSTPYVSSSLAPLPSARMPRWSASMAPQRSVSAFAGTLAPASQGEAVPADAAARLSQPAAAPQPPLPAALFNRAGPASAAAPRASSPGMRPVIQDEQRQRHLPRASEPVLRVPGITIDTTTAPRAPGADREPDDSPV